MPAFLYDARRSRLRRWVLDTLATVMVEWGMVISHKDCDHPSTPGARAKCRRQQAGAPPREVDLSRVKGPKENKQQTPRDRDKQCMVCGIERIVYRGTDPLSGLLLFVGERCEYMVRRSLDKAEVE